MAQLSEGLGENRHVQVMLGVVLLCVWGSVVYRVTDEVKDEGNVSHSRSIVQAGHEASEDVQEASIYGGDFRDPFRMPDEVLGRSAQKTVEKGAPSNEEAPSKRTPHIAAHRRRSDPGNQLPDTRKVYDVIGVVNSLAILQRRPGAAGAEGLHFVRVGDALGDQSNVSEIGSDFVIIRSRKRSAERRQIDTLWIDSDPKR